MEETSYLEQQAPGALVGNPRKCDLAKVIEVDGIKISLGSGHVSGPSRRSWAEGEL